jgi:hypothetical protein
VRHLLAVGSLEGAGAQHVCCCWCCFWSWIRPVGAAGQAGQAVCSTPWAPPAPEPLPNSVMAVALLQRLAPFLQEAPAPLVGGCAAAPMRCSGQHRVGGSGSAAVGRSCAASGVASPYAHRCGVPAARPS